MNTKILISIPLLCLGLCLAQDLPADIQSSLPALASWAPGADTQPRQKVEAYAFALRPDAPERAALEKALCQALDKSKTREARTFLGKMLRVVGTEACIPHVEKWLSDPDGSHGARLALGHLASPKAGAALHRGLQQSRGHARIGIIGSLGERGYQPALADLATLTAEPETASAALRAIGLIGGSDALAALTPFKPTPETRTAHTHALLRAAESVGGNQAYPVYKKLYDSPRVADKLAGLHGLVRVAPENAADLLSEAMQGDNLLLSASAVSLLAESGGKETTLRFAAMLKDLPDTTQIPILRALATRGDPAAADAVMERLNHGGEAVRLAALDAMSTLGDGSHVPTLLAIAASDNGAQQARSTLARMQGEDVGAALKTAAANGEINQRAEALRAIAARGNREMGRTILQMLGREEDATLRREMVRGLSKLVKADDLSAVIAAAANARDPREIAGFELAVKSLHKQGADPEAMNRLIEQQLSKALAANQPGLLKLLAIPATEQGLARVQKARSSDLEDAAVRTLAEWPTLDAAPALFDIAGKTENAVHNALALRGYVRLAGQSPDPEKLFRQALSVAKEPAQLKMVLGGLSSAGSVEALKRVAGYLDNDAVRNEAALSSIQIAGRVKTADAALTRTVMQQILETVEDKGVRKAAQQFLNEFDTYEGYIFAWHVSPLYQLKGKDSRALWAASLGPEVADSKIKWKPLKKGFNDWACDLGSTHGNQDNAATFVRTTILSDADQDARLELGSDDALKVWLNDQEIHAWYGSRGTSPANDIIKVKLKKGRNPLLLKIVNHGGGWGFAARVRKPDGSAIQGITCERAKP